MKKCSHCKRINSLDSFNKNKCKKDGLQNFCKSCLKIKRTALVNVTCDHCHKIYQVKYRTTNSYWRKRGSKIIKQLCRGCQLSHTSAITRVKFRGAGNPSWKGGSNPATKAFYVSSQWLTLRKDIIKRDKSTCQSCLQTFEKNLEVNHIKARCEFPELALIESNLETLCKACHKKKTVEWKLVRSRSRDANVGFSQSAVNRSLP